MCLCMRPTSLGSSEGVLAAAGGAKVELPFRSCLLFFNVLVLLRVSESHNV